MAADGADVAARPANAGSSLPGLQTMWPLLGRATRRISDVLRSATPARLIKYMRPCVPVFDLCLKSLLFVLMMMVTIYIDNYT